MKMSSPLLYLCLMVIAMVVLNRSEAEDAMVCDTYDETSVDEQNKEKCVGRTLFKEVTDQKTVNEINKKLGKLAKQLNNSHKQYSDLQKNFSYVINQTKKDYDVLAKQLNNSQKQYSDLQKNCSKEYDELAKQLNNLQQQYSDLQKNFSYVINQTKKDYDDYIENCTVGMKDGRVRDEDITASSTWSGYPARHARLDDTRPSWVPPNGVAGQWLQVDLRSPTMVTGVITQGYSGGTHWVTSYKISFGNSTNDMQVIQGESGGDKVFVGNTDYNTWVMNRFPQPITARYFRLIVQTFSGSWPSVRLEYVTF